MEIKVKQRSQEWFDKRSSVTLTASRFGDVLGLGRGKPYDFFMSVISDDNGDPEQTDSIKHGIEMESVIHEAYELLTGNKTRESGFWVPCVGDTMKDLIGASPDAIVYDVNDSKKEVGLCEFKAPVYQMYNKENSIGGIPRYYMAQIQGQMAVTGFLWCDFMAVCVKTEEIMLKRVFFQPDYWQKISAVIKQFCFAVQESKLRKQVNKNPLDFEGARKIKEMMFHNELYPGEDLIMIQDLLKRNIPTKTMCGPSKLWLSYDFLMGKPYKLPTTLQFYAHSLLWQVDREVALKRKSFDYKTGPISKFRR